MTDQHTPPMGLSPEVKARFLAKIDRSDGCWIWTATRTSVGYGHFNVGGGQMVLAHRVSFSLYVAPIPRGREIHHTCGVRECVNPDHLRAVTRSEHMRLDGRQWKTHCKRGHEFTPENVRIFTGRDGHTRRYCRLCHRDRSREWWRAKKAAMA